MTIDSISLSTGTESRTIWLRHSIVLGTLILLLGVAYWPALAAAVEVWWVSPTFSHCFLIIPISAYLIWEKRETLQNLTPRVYPLALIGFIPFILFWYVGHIVAVNEVQQFSFMAMVQIVILATLGPSVYRVILFPALYLFFLVPTGEYLIGPLQKFTTHFIDVGLNILGVPHYTEGTIVELATGRYEVEEACAGLRFLIATIALGTLFAYLTYRKWYKIAIFMAASFVIPVIGNGFRALGIVLLAYMSNNKIAVGFDHIVYGWGFSVAILLFLFFVGSRFKDQSAEEDFTEERRVTPPGALLLTAAIAIFATLSGPALAYWNSNRALAIDASALAFPKTLGGYNIGNITGQWRPKFGEPAAQLAASFNLPASFAPPVDAFVYYYTGADKGHTLIESTNRLWDEHDWNAVSSAGVTARIGNRPVKMNELILSSPLQRRLVWTVYWANGKFTNSGMDVRLSRLNAAFGGPHGSALVAVSTPIEGVTDNDARNRLAHVLSTMTGLSSELSSVGNSGHSH